MRSIRLARVAVKDLPKVNEILKIVTLGDSIALATSSQLYISQEKSEFQEIPLLSPSPLVDIHFLFDGSLWMAHEGGEVAKFDPALFEVEELGVQDGGILAARWSPDGELLLIIGATLEAEDSLQVLTADFDPIAVEPAVSIEKGEQIMVNVGWGSRSTQFMGSAGKESREIEILEATKLSPKDNHLVEICWRGDADLFCTSVPCSSGRRTRIYNREGIHLSTTESSSTFLGPISWRASSLLSSVADAISGAPIIAQIERNGLEHGQIELILTKTVKKIQWNSTGVVLLVQYEDSFELWRQGNYHWYRQVLESLPSLSYIVWDDFAANKLHLSCHGVMTSFIVEQFVNTNELAKIVVADGINNNWTDLEQAIIPPPMSMSQTDSFSSRPSCAGIGGPIVVTEDKIIDIKGDHVYKGEFGDVRQVYHSTEADTVLVVHDKPTKSVIETFGYMKVSAEVDGYVTQIVFSGMNTVFLSVVNDANSVELFEGKLNKVEATVDFTFINAFDSHIKSLSQSQGLPVYLVKSQPYYGANRLMLKSGETALSISSNNSFIAATTTHHELLIWNVAQLQKSKASPPIRRGCERGASIVSIFGTKVVLQMPRGNIETVEPRAMLLKKLGSLLDQGESINWLEMFKICRRQRVNLNLLVDHSGYSKFSAGDFFTQLLPPTSGKNEVAAFNTFLFELEGQNCTYPGGLYHGIYGRDGMATEGEKVKTICNEIAAKVLNPASTCQFISIYLHCRLKVDGMESAMKSMTKLRTQSAVPVERLTEGIKFLAVMQQGDHDLYHFALKTFDLDLALITAQALELDPKEYLANLNRLDKLEANRREFDILNQLECRVEAIEKLIELNKEGLSEGLISVEDYTNKHSLFNHVIRLPNLTRPFKKVICKAWGEKLQNNGHELQAAILLKQSGDDVTSSQLFLKRHRWRLAVTKPTSSGDFQQLTSSFPAQDAGHMVWNMKRDPEESVNLYVEASQFESALMVCNQANRLDLIQTDVEPAVKSHAKLILEQIKDLAEKWTLRIGRIEDCRVNQQKKIQIMNDGFDEEQGDFDDLVSDLGSVRTGSSKASRSSRSTAKSAKARRKTERKKFSTRKGSPTEHLGLMEEARSAVNRFQKIVDEMGEFFVILGYVGEFVIGQQIQAIIKQFIHSLDHEVYKIWPRDEEGLALLESFQKEGTLRDLRDLSVLAPPEIPKRFHNFSIFD